MPIPPPQTVLIISQLYDPSVNDVIGELDARGIPHFRLNTEEFPLNVRVAVDPTTNSPGGEITSVRTGESLPLSDVRSVCYRRSAPHVLPECEQHERDYLLRECQGLLNGLWRTLPILWVNSPAREREAILKLRQLQVAAELGLAVPRTLATNDPDRVRAFVESLDSGVVFKAVTHGYVGDLRKSFAVHPVAKAGLEAVFDDAPAAPPYSAADFSSVIMTHRLTDDKLAVLDSLVSSPAIFQEEVPKDVELRITVVGRRMFVAEIRSQESEDGEVDFRRIYLDNRDAVEADFLALHGIHELPPKVEGQLHELMDALGLAFGCIDMILTPLGEYIFIEISPSGQWQWLEAGLEFPISEALADLLARGVA